MNHFNEAAKNLPGNWCKGDLYDQRGNACMGGHVKNALGEARYNPFPTAENPYRTLWSASLELLSNVAYEQYPDRVRGSGGWNVADLNDAEETTEAEAVAILEKAAVRWDELYG